MGCQGAITAESAKAVKTVTVAKFLDFLDFPSISKSAKVDFEEGGELAPPRNLPS